MPWSFWTNYCFALAIVALILGGLFALTRGIARRRVLIVAADRRLVTVLESTALSQQSYLHVVKAGARYVLIGASQASLVMLGELSPGDVDEWLVRRRCARETKST